MRKKIKIRNDLSDEEMIAFRRVFAKENDITEERAGRIIGEISPCFDVIPYMILFVRALQKIPNDFAKIAIREVAKIIDEEEGGEEDES